MLDNMAENPMMVEEPMTSSPPPPPSLLYDLLLALPYLTCLLLGVPANLCALAYFLRKKKRDIPNYLYIFR